MCKENLAAEPELRQHCQFKVLAVQSMPNKMFPVRTPQTKGTLACDQNLTLVAACVGCPLTGDALKV